MNLLIYISAYMQFALNICLDADEFAKSLRRGTHAIKKNATMRVNRKHIYNNKHVPDVVRLCVYAFKQVGGILLHRSKQKT